LVSIARVQINFVIKAEIISSYYTKFNLNFLYMQKYKCKKEKLLMISEQFPLTEGFIMSVEYLLYEYFSLLGCDMVQIGEYL